LTKGDYVFRQAIASASTLERAAELAVVADETFEPGGGVLAMLHAALVTSVTPAAGTKS
jgi:hypothetical protein